MDLPVAIDAHAHAFVRGLPLAPGRRYAPDYDAPVETYLAHLDRNGLTHGVLVQPSFLGTDNAYLVASLARAPERLRGIAVVDPGIAPEELARLDGAGVVGLRLNLVGQPLPDLGTPAWTRLLHAAADLGWSVEIQRAAADLGRLVPPLLDRGVPVVLDHFALLDPAAAGGEDPHLRAVLRLGASRRVWVKLAAPYRCGAPSADLVGRLYARLRDAFGLNRLMWGSDWPHTQFEDTQSYGGSRRFLTTLVADAAAEASLLAAPRSLFRFDPPGG